MKYSVSQLLALVDDGKLSMEDCPDDLLEEFHSDGENYLETVSLCYCFSETDGDMLKYLTEIIEKYAVVDKSSWENPYCYGCTKESCITCDINNYGHPLWFDE